MLGIHDLPPVQTYVEWRAEWTDSAHTGAMQITVMVRENRDGLSYLTMRRDARGWRISSKYFVCFARQLEDVLLPAEFGLSR
jgi:hypothetical protein